jgi:histidinol-phosphate/aromatic aminotransferase/cobyric acid decarboxylase-like protein
MNGAYLTSIARDMMRSMASFPTNGLSVYLARAALGPATSLCKKLFTAIGEWHDRLAAKKLSPDNSNPI